MELQSRPMSAPLRAHRKAVAAKSISRKEALHDNASTTHDRGHAYAGADPFAFK
jgi:hypothetical protein